MFQQGCVIHSLCGVEGANNCNRAKVHSNQLQLGTCLILKDLTIQCLLHHRGLAGAKGPSHFTRTQPTLDTSTCQSSMALRAPSAEWRPQGLRATTDQATAFGDASDGRSEGVLTQYIDGH